MRRGLLALAVTAAVTAGGGGLAATAALAADTASRDMHDRMTSTGSMDMSAMDMGSMAGMHSPEMDAVHTQMLEQMPEETRAACADMHAQMTTEAANGPTDHAAHHES